MRYRLAPLKCVIVVLSLAFGVVGMQSADATSQIPPRSDAAGVQGLMARVGSPSKVALRAYKMVGTQDVKSHTLTDSERAEVAAALASLPTLNRQILEKNLHHLAFLDGIPGEGTALTSPATKKGFYDITIRASVLKESLSTFLTTKEHRVFTADGSGITVSVEGSGVDALTYLLLHESTHVLDYSCNITTEPHSRFVEGIWTDTHTMVPQLASSAAATTYFHQGRPLGFGKAVTVYDSLAQSPFVSLYATASEREDLAELVAWREIMTRHGGNLRIEVSDSQGNILRRWEPLTFPGVKERFAEVDELLASKEYCGISS
jgi:hypothetical protein